jgi:acetolactate synthase-1/2/3 large subunit
MGYGLPGALGAKAAFPDRQVVSLSGDGGFLMTVQELATAVQFDLPVVALVVNDHCLTSIRRGQERDFGATLGVELHNPDFVKLAEAFGALAWRVDSPETFRGALRQALGAGVMSVIEIAHTWPDS